MPGTATRTLYLARHGEASPDETGLTDSGRRQAVLLGDRFRSVPLSVVRHGPLPRAELTARLIHGRLGGNVPLEVSETAGDYVPYVAQRHELPPDSADLLLNRLAVFSPKECAEGPELARRAVAEFTGPVLGDEPRHELVVTHAFLVGWLVRAALDAPRWRWLGLHVANAALTVIRYAPDRPVSLALYNDMAHLPADLRWTGFPSDLHI
ncbi:histidine phosphatase family protein [Streptomyces sp. NPDC058001]|uniref:histidine phosphatase family protein n=1 Tax=Streptomyces sp. NPDC058001 TaxID=3346300 RepID=UPI0036E9002F